MSTINQTLFNNLISQLSKMHIEEFVREFSLRLLDGITPLSPSTSLNSAPGSSLCSSREGQHEFLPTRGPHSSLCVTSHPLSVSIERASWGADDATARVLGCEGRLRRRTSVAGAF
jgi:hypothetical protein